MSYKKNLCDFCVGIVTIITLDHNVLTGRIVPDRAEADCDEEFITLTLTALPLLIPGSAGPGAVLPFFQVGDTLKINVDNIVTIGPAQPTP